MHRLVAICVVTSVTLLGGAVSPAPVHAGDSRCLALQDVVPAAFAAITGDLAGAARHARALRELSTRELVPRRIKPALRTLARFFEEAPDMSLLERAQELPKITRPLARVIRHTALTCPHGPSTTSTSRPLR